MAPILTEPLRRSGINADTIAMATFLNFIEDLKIETSDRITMALGMSVAFNLILISFLFYRLTAR